MKPSHTPEQILHSFIEKEKKVLQIGGDAALKDLVSPTEFRQMLLEELENLENIPNGYDYIVIGDVLEYVEDPVKVIEHIKNLAGKCIIFEFKYDNPEWILDANWKRPWSRIGLEHSLSKNFDYLNQIFLEHATIHICHTPYNGEDELDARK